MFKKLFSFKSLFVAALLSSLGIQAQNALKLDGTNDYVITTHAGITGSGARTVEAWIKGPAVTAQQIITEWGGGAADGARWTFKTMSNKLRIETGGGTTVYLSGVATVLDNNWHHVAVTFDPNATSNKYKLYVDGTLDAQANFASAATTTEALVQIGARAINVSATKFSGTIDDVRIWNVARTQAEIQANKNTELCVPVNGLVAYYKFNEGVANGTNTAITTAADATGASSGTLTNFALTGTTSNFVTGTTLSADIPVALTTLNGTTLTANLIAGATYQWLDCGNANAIIPNAAAQTYTPTVSGSYAVKITTGGGCTATSVCTEVPVCNVNTTVTVSGTMLIAAQQTGGATYQWIDCANNNEPIDDATQITYSPPVSGNYAVIITLPNTCTATSGCTYVCNLNDEVTLEGTTLTAAQDNASYQWIDCANNNEPINDANGQTFTPSVTGNYAVIISTPDNCTITSLCTEVLVCNVDAGVNNNAGTLMAVEQEGATYQWIDCANNNEPVDDAIGVSFTPTVSGSYAVIITLSNSCTAISECQYVLVCSLNAEVTLSGTMLIAAQQIGGADYQWINCATNEPVDDATNITFTPTVSGNYAVIITAANTCTVTSECTQVCIISDEVVNNGGTLTAMQEGASYQWINCADNEPIDNANGQTFTPTATGGYAVIISTPDNCTVTSDCTELEVAGTDSFFASQLLAYPNPTSGMVTVNMADTYSNVTLVIRNITGQVISTQQFDQAQNISADLTNAAAGMYFLNIKAGDGQFAVIKVVKR